jgi:hypothetical protein
VVSRPSSDGIVVVHTSSPGFDISVSTIDLTPPSTDTFLATQIAQLQEENDLLKKQLKLMDEDLVHQLETIQSLSKMRRPKQPLRVMLSKREGKRANDHVDTKRITKKRRMITAE